MVHEDWAIANANLHVLLLAHRLLSASVHQPFGWGFELALGLDGEGRSESGAESAVGLWEFGVDVAHVFHLELGLGWPRWTVPRSAGIGLLVLSHWRN